MDAWDAPDRGRTLAPVLVIALLVALATVPILTQIRIRELRSEIVDVAAPARTLVTELQLRLSAEAMAARAFMLTREPAYARVYFEAEEERARVYARLLPLTRRLDPPIAERAAELASIFATSDTLLRRTITGQVSIDRYLERLPERQAAFARTTATVALLHRAIGDVVARQTSAIRSTERIGIGITIALVLVALAAVTAVGRLMAERSRLAEERGRILQAERRARAEAEKRRVELERVTESRAGLMRGFSHDVKNPLGAADGYLELLEDGIVDTVTDRQRESLHRARRSLAAALRLIEDLVALARAEAMEIEPRPVDLRGLTKELAEEHRARAEARGLELRVELPDPIPILQTDPGRVEQIVGNLLSNAVKYTRRGGVTVRAGIREAAREGPLRKWAVVQVADTGPGIAEDQHARLFREFERADTALDTEGAGIGLAISQRLAHALGGDITVESEPGLGSTFTLWLPAG